MRGYCTWMALFSTWTDTYVADQDWDQWAWHVWGAALIKSQTDSGKHLIIWDCNPCKIILDV